MLRDVVVLALAGLLSTLVLSQLVAQDADAPACARCLEWTVAGQSQAVAYQVNGPDLDLEVARVAESHQDSIPVSLAVADLFPDASATRILSVYGQASLRLRTAAGRVVRIRDLYGLDRDSPDRFSTLVRRVDFPGDSIAGSLHPYHSGLAPSPLGWEGGVLLASHPTEGYRAVWRAFSIEELWRLELRNLLLIGFLVGLACYFSALFLRVERRAIFGYYALYLWLQAAYWAERSLVIGQQLPVRLIDSYAFNVSIQLAFHVAYVLFALELIEGHRYPRWERIWRSACAVIASLAVLLPLGLYAGAELSWVIGAFTVERLVVVALSGASIAFFLARPRTVYVYYFAAGSALFLGGAVYALFTKDMLYFQLGVFADALVFSYAAGSKVRALERERTDSRRRAVALEREVLRTKDAALRAQMSPHFVSNVVNALRALVLEGAVDETYDYLTRFGHVVRMMLRTADSPTISLAEELKLLLDYVSLEELRFGRSLNLTITLAEGVAADQIAIPPLVLQPLVENAVHHGLTHLTDRIPELVVHVDTVGRDLRIQVTDNGIGRERAARRARERIVARKRESVALPVLSDRLRLFSGDDALEHHGIEIVDLLGEAGSPAGTRAVVVIPIRGIGSADGAIAPAQSLAESHDERR